MSEAGHTRNVAKFGELIAVVNGMGALYNPPVVAIEITKLQFKQTGNQTVMTAVQTTDAAEEFAVNHRQDLHARLDDTAKRFVAAVEVSSSDALFIEDLKNDKRRFDGRRAGDKPVDDPSTPDVDESQNIHSVSQLSYDYRTERFAEMVNKVEAHGDYVTNEADLQIAALKDYVAEMQTANTTITQTATAAENARNAREIFIQRHRRHHRPRQQSKNLRQIQERRRRFLPTVDSDPVQRTERLKGDISKRKIPAGKFSAVKYNCAEIKLISLQ